ncbi:hypothetical protein H4Q26_009108 [Puccinia striiformis f. sp. tritici PST-130]|nr:hypothetical protein H4Q26_009108 [Puccinia striiformis f. sp. tritici PST-130]
MSLCSINLCLHFFFLINRAVARRSNPGGTEVVRVNGFLDLNKPPPDEALTAALFPSQPPAEPLRAFGADHMWRDKKRSRTHRLLRKLAEFASAEDPVINTAEDSHQKPSASQTTKEAPTPTEGSDVKLNARHDKNTPLNFNKQTYTVLNVHNWKFVQNNREEETPMATCRQPPKNPQLINYLNSSIRHNTGLFLKRYARYRNQVCYPVADDAHRISFIFENVLRIADEKFGLKRSDTFLKEMEDSLAINLKSARNSSSKGQYRLVQLQQ